MPYRPNVCLLVYNQNKELLVGERLSQDLVNSEIWQLPQGGIDPEEKISEAALREAHEELGVDYKFLKLIKVLEATNQYDFDPIPEFAIGRWRGQSQNFVLISFVGSEKDFNLNRYDPEFSSYQWISAEKLLDLVEFKRRKGYELVITEYLDLKRTGKI